MFPSSVASLRASNWRRRSWTRRSLLFLPQSTFTTMRSTWVLFGLSLHKYSMIQFKLLTVFSNPGIRLSSEVPHRLWRLRPLRSVCSSSDWRILQNNSGTQIPLWSDRLSWWFIFISHHLSDVTLNIRLNLLQVIEETLSPTWDESMVFEEILVYGRREDIKANPPIIIVETYDQDKVRIQKFISVTSWQNFAGW